jgi:hypothetical protein
VRPEGLDEFKNSPHHINIFTDIKTPFTLFPSAGPRGFKNVKYFLGEVFSPTLNPKTVRPGTTRLVPNFLTCHGWQMALQEAYAPTSIQITF